MFESLLKEFEMDEKNEPEKTTSPNTPSSKSKSNENADSPATKKAESKESSTNPTIISEILELIRPLNQIHQAISTTIFEDGSSSIFSPSTREELQPFLEQTETIIRTLSYFGKTELYKGKKLYLSVLSLPKYESLRKQITNLAHQLEKLSYNIEKLDKNHTVDEHKKIVKKLIKFGEKKSGELDLLSIDLKAVVNSPEATEKLTSKQKEVADNAAKEKERQKKLMDAAKNQKSNSSSSGYNSFPYQSNRSPYGVSGYDGYQEPYGNSTSKRSEQSDFTGINENNNKFDTKKDKEKEDDKRNRGNALPQKEDNHRETIKNFALLQSVKNNSMTSKLSTLIGKPYPDTFETLSEIYADKSLLPWTQQAGHAIEVISLLDTEEQESSLPTKSLEKNKKESAEKLSEQQKLVQLKQELKQKLITLQPVLVALARHPVAENLVEVPGEHSGFFKKIIIAYQEKYNLAPADVYKKQEQLEELATNLTQLGAPTFETIFKQHDQAVAAFETRRNTEWIKTLEELQQFEVVDDIANCKKIITTCEKLCQIPLHPTYRSASLNDDLDKVRVEQTPMLLSRFNPILKILDEYKSLPNNPLTPYLKKAAAAIYKCTHYWGIFLNGSTAPIKQPKQTQEEPIEPEIPAELREENIALPPVEEQESPGFISSLWNSFKGLFS